MDNSIYEQQQKIRLYQWTRTQSSEKFRSDEMCVCVCGFRFIFWTTHKMSFRRLSVCFSLKCQWLKAENKIPNDMLSASSAVTEYHNNLYKVKCVSVSTLFDLIWFFLAKWSRKITDKKHTMRERERNRRRKEKPKKKKNYKPITRM